VVASKGATVEGKEFATMMVQDHTKANAELAGLAAKKNITLPTTLREDHQKVLHDVTEEKGVEMDKEYLKEMVKDHEEDVKEFKEASVKASDPEIKAFATKQVPVLQHHLEMAQQMSATLEARN
jgi:putative membrane protein